MLHRRAKQIICEQNNITLPGGEIYHYQSAIAEKTIDRYRADVELKSANDSLIVEIIVTCEVSDVKLAYLNRSGKRLLVIDLQDVDRNIDDQSLTELLIKDIYWKNLITPNPVVVKSSSRDTGFSITEWIGAAILSVLFLLLFFPKTIRSIFGFDSRKNSRY